MALSRPSFPKPKSSNSIPIVMDQSSRKEADNSNNRVNTNSNPFLTHGKVNNNNNNNNIGGNDSAGRWSNGHPGLIPNDTMLAISLAALLSFLLYEIYCSRGNRKRKTEISSQNGKSNGVSSSGHNQSTIPVTSGNECPVPSSRRHIPLPQPVFHGVPRMVPAVMDTASLARYLPPRTITYVLCDEEEDENSASEEVKEERMSKERDKEALVIGLPNIPGCEIFSPAVDKLVKDLSGLGVTRADIVRFLVARKGNMDLATDMIKKATQWHRVSLPLRSSPEILRALATKCFFPHGVDRDGAPVIYFRGCLYDSTKASFQTYVIAAAHSIDWAIRRSNHCAVTVLVHTSTVKGGPNESADVNFIKGFIQTLSDNFPERLKRLAIFPFPWYGRAMWSVIRMFVDKRTQDKVLLVPQSGRGLPKEVCAIVSPDEIPDFIGGTDTRPIINLEETLLPALSEMGAENQSNAASNADIANVL